MHSGGHPENGRRDCGGNRFDVPLPGSPRFTGNHQTARPEMGHRFQSGNTLRRTSLEAAPLHPGRLRVVFRRGLPKAAGRDLPPCLHGAGRGAFVCPNGGRFARERLQHAKKVRYAGAFPETLRQG